MEMKGESFNVLIDKE